jgi:hypothetical protein
VLTGTRARVVQDMVRDLRGDLVLRNDIRVGQVGDLLTLGSLAVAGLRVAHDRFVVVGLGAYPYPVSTSATRVCVRKN